MADDITIKITGEIREATKDIEVLSKTALANAKASEKASKSFEDFAKVLKISSSEMKKEMSSFIDSWDSLHSSIGSALNNTEDLLLDFKTESEGAFVSFGKNLAEIFISPSKGIFSKMTEASLLFFTFTISNIKERLDREKEAGEKRIALAKEEAFEKEKILTSLNEKYEESEMSLLRISEKLASTRIEALEEEKDKALEAFDKKWEGYEEYSELVAESKSKEFDLAEEKARKAFENRKADFESQYNIRYDDLKRLYETDRDFFKENYLSRASYEERLSFFSLLREDNISDKTRERLEMELEYENKIAEEKRRLANLEKEIAIQRLRSEARQSLKQYDKDISGARDAGDEVLAEKILSERNSSLETFARLIAATKGDESLWADVLSDITFAANGFDGTVSSPTMFIAGEAGPEYVNITPLSSSSAVTNNNGSVVEIGSIHIENTKGADDIAFRFIEEMERMGVRVVNR